MEYKLLKRSHNCGELRKKNVGNEVILNGWISKRRDHGGLIFIDLRDRYGKTQIIFNEEIQPDAYNQIFRLGLEDVIGVKGKVILRPDDAINSDISTGEIDIEVIEIQVFNEADQMPFNVNDRNSASEDHRLKFRYLELRTKEMQENLKLRHETAQITRKFLHEKEFIEVETPILMKSTPEGARDFLVPSRLHKGKFYALPQSPQTYKQLLMVSGIDKYFQIVKCFRDEDFRADRQPEFTQIDIEMSFIQQDDIIKIGTDLTRKIWSETIGIELPNKFPVMTYQDALENYGIDRPDTRFGMLLQEFSEFVQKSNFNAFKTVLDNDGRVKAIVASGCAKYSRKIIDELTDFLKQYHNAKGLAWMKSTNGDLEGGISKFFNEDLRQEIIKSCNINDNDIVFIVGDKSKIVFSALSALRLEIAKRENLIDQNIWAPIWIVDFPLVEWNEDENRFDALHHPFTSPNFDDIDKMDSNPGNVRSLAYDIVMNGYEIGGGSIRIHSSELQAKIFNLLGISNEEAEEKFGFLMNAFKYGAPPHGGMAFGFDRIVMLLANCSQIRDVIAFPKTTSAISLMDNSPANVDKNQLKDLHLEIIRT
ncbi:MAG: aspartate--tRNA ligase [Candidatus Marinimicrobia bacterium]|nr:aspartate--tRNA ligase [Candidatus Neomarinimicrobiota bacterium]